MLMLTPPKKAKVSRNLAPTKTAGKIFIPGFHRTRQESAAASVIMDSLDSKKLRRSCLYGQGFYMARTYANQNRERMINNYGQHLVRCQVDISRFICFDRAIARRVWGDKHTLKDQLMHFGPWDVVQKHDIARFSKALSAFWENKKHPDAYIEFAGTRKRIEKIINTSDVAMTAYSRLGLDKKVPGIVYTGKNDGACVLAYRLDRVTPLQMAETGKRPVNKTKVKWFNATDRELKRKHAPDAAMKDDVETYCHHLATVKKAADKKALILDSYAQLPREGFDQMAFCLAVIKTCRSPSLHEVRDEIIARTVSFIVDLIPYPLPHFCYASRDGSTRHDRRFLPYPLMYDQAYTDTDKDEEMVRKNSDRYLKLLKSSHLWSYIRYEIFLRISFYHTVHFIPDAKDAFYKMKDNAGNYSALRTLHPLFGGYINGYDEFKDKPHRGSLRMRGDKTDPVDGIILASDMIRQLRSVEGYSHRHKIRPRLRKRNPRTPLHPFIKLLGAEEYELFMRCQILKIYDILRKAPGAQNQHIKKILAEWYKRDGIKHRRLVKENPDYNHIGALQ